MDQARDPRKRSTRGRECEPPLPEPLAYFLAWFKNGRFRVALGISARTLIGPARWSGFT